MEDKGQRQERTVRRGAQGAPNPQEAAEGRASGALAEGRAVIEEMDRLFREASQTPIVKTHRLIREDAYEDLMGQLRIVLPKMVREAQGVLDRRDEITGEAEAVSRAQAYAAEIRTDAEERAASVVQQAAHQTDLMLSGAAAALSRSAGEMAQLRDSLLTANKGEGQPAAAERNAR